MIASRARKGRSTAIPPEVTTAPMVIHSGGTPYLTFSAGHSHYALYIVSTTAIVDAPSIAADPRMPEFVKGAVQVEDRLIPVIDLASRMGLPPARVARRCCVVLVNAHLGDKVIEVGVEVDHVQEVLDLGRPEPDLPPPCGANINTHFVELMAKRPGHYAMVMHVEQLLFTDELLALSELEELADDVVHH
ncbi:MAG: chemotaxis protein CheW [Aquabacterium sp.]|uniref:chemotaxis protein CheW n=1 Tax=Aquabacterium sp. TaxID=1872578 RepID=UPI0025BF91BD|nr:chemotaxis protein CheW [Aquabacterium sp.]MBI5924087.1 chemotaxis protein CheW [Aquabacterium sp.]